MQNVKAALQLRYKLLPLWYTAFEEYHRLGKTVVPMKSRMRRSSECMHADPHTLNVYVNQQTKTAKGHLYIDDYKTKTYQDGKSFLKADFSYSNGVLWQGGHHGTAPAGVSTEVERIEIFGLTAEPTKAFV